MSYELATLQLSDMTQLGAALRQLGHGATSVEDTARRIVRFLHDELIDPASGKPGCPLVRFYQALPYSDLEPNLQSFAQQVMDGVLVSDNTRCLTLLATAGSENAWNSRFESVGHKTIPLVSAEVLSRLPMVAQLLSQLGLDLAKVVNPDPSLLMELEQKNYNVFYVPDALGSPYIPAQKDFVEPYGIRSVIGFGGVLASGDVFAVLMFSRTAVPLGTAEIFRVAALAVKVAITPFAFGPIFGTE